jgi:hypothetical protein
MDPIIKWINKRGFIINNKVKSFFEIIKEEKYYNEYIFKKNECSKEKIYFLLYGKGNIRFIN